MTCSHCAAFLLNPTSRNSRKALADSRNSNRERAGWRRVPDDSHDWYYGSKTEKLSRTRDPADGGESPRLHALVYHAARHCPHVQPDGIRNIQAAIPNSDDAHDRVLPAGSDQRVLFYAAR